MTSPATTTLRLRRIRFKDGRTLDVLRPFDTDEVRKKSDVLRKVEEVLRLHCSELPSIAGFAFVVWDALGGSTADMRGGHGSFPVIYAPDFVRNRLLALKIEEWSRL